MTSGEQTTREGAAERLGVSLATVDRYLAAGLLTRRKNAITGRVTVDLDQVEALRREREGLPPGQEN